MGFPYHHSGDGLFSLSFLIFIYLAMPDLSCSMQALLVLAFELLVTARGI